jgi:hypothetical protein
MVIYMQQDLNCFGITFKVFFIEVVILFVKCGEDLGTSKNIGYFQRKAFMEISA